MEASVFVRNERYGELLYTLHTDWDAFQIELRRLFAENDPEAFAAAQSNEKDPDISVLSSLLHDRLPREYRHEECSILWEWLDEYADVAEDHADSAWVEDYLQLQEAFGVVRSFGGRVIMP